MSRCSRSAGDRCPENPNPISHSADHRWCCPRPGPRPSCDSSRTGTGLNLFLPPLLYPAAISWRYFRANLRSILPLTIVLVFLTMIAAAYVQTRTPVENVGRQSRKRATVASLLFRTQPIWGAQAASLLSLAACRRLPRVARIPCAECSKSFSAGCRKGQAGSCVLPRTDQIASKLISI